MNKTKKKRDTKCRFLVVVMNENDLKYCLFEFFQLTVRISHSKTNQRKQLFARYPDIKAIIVNMKLVY